ncbi:MAG: ferritin family protein [Methanobacteriota archaeon]
MELTKYHLEDLLLAAIKSEVESKNCYTKLAVIIKNALIKDKLLFLAKEEENHQRFIENIYTKRFPGKKLILPKKTPIPLPGILSLDENTPLSKVLQSAMNAEQSAHEFYKSLAQRFTDDSSAKNMLMYFADMELQHYKILEIEKQSMERFEEADIYWPMVHAGP